MSTPGMMSKSPSKVQLLIDPPSPKILKKRKAESELKHVDAYMADEETHVDQRKGSSGSSDQATDTVFMLSSCSPEQRDGRGGDELKDLPSCTGGRNDIPGGTGMEIPVANHKTAPSSRRSTSLACQAGNGFVLAPSCLAPSKLSAAAISIRSISPFDMTMPVAGPSQEQPTKPYQVDDVYINGLIDRARNIKHAVDKEQKGKRWTVRALCKYLESSLVYMEACEHSHQSNTKSSRRIAW